MSNRYHSSWRGTMSSRSGYNMPEDSRADEIIKDLQRRIADLERLARSQATSIDSGALSILKNGIPVAVLGDLNEAVTSIDMSAPDGTPQMGFILKRDTGEYVFSLADY